MVLSETFWKMAENFVRMINRESGCPVIVCDENGVITCSTAPERIGSTHSGAVRIMAGEVDEVFVTAEEAEANPLIKEGYNCVIQTEKGRFGTFGIAGSLETVKPLARIASVVMTSWIHELEQKDRIDETSQTVFAGVGELTARNKEIGERSQALFQEIEEAAREVIGNISVTDDILKTIHDISARSGILSLNGTIEASRAGAHGRAFAVVADEMRQMAKNTKEAAATIEANMTTIKDSIASLNTAVESFSGIADDQYRIIDETVARISELRTAMEALRTS